MADPAFPTTLWEIQDSKYFEVEQEDNAVKGDTEGGYVYSRPRHTRKPRKTFTTGYTDISHANYLALQAFYDQVGTHGIFTWSDPTTAVSYRVRFDKPFKAQYTGAGIAKLWTVAGIQLKEA